MSTQLNYEVECLSCGLFHEYRLMLCIQVSGRPGDRQLTDDVRPLQAEVVWMSDSAAEYAK